MLKVLEILLLSIIGVHGYFVLFHGLYDQVFESVEILWNFYFFTDEVKEWKI